MWPPRKTVDAFDRLAAAPGGVLEALANWPVMRRYVRRGFVRVEASALGPSYARYALTDAGRRRACGYRGRFAG